MTQLNTASYGDGYSSYYNEWDVIGNIVQSMGALDYTPDLSDPHVNGEYYPGATGQDAGALFYLGYMTEDDITRETTGSRAGDLAVSGGAWDPKFQDAVRNFQGANGVTPVDGWIGPVTRAALAAAVQAKNLGDQPNTPPFQPPNIPPGGLPGQPGQDPNLPPFIPGNGGGAGPAAGNGAATSGTPWGLLAIGAIAIVAVGALAFGKPSSGSYEEEEDYEG